MPQTHQAFTYVAIPPTYITPIVCPHCGAHAHLVRREYRFELQGERRTFECDTCKKQIEMTLED